MPSPVRFPQLTLLLATVGLLSCTGSVGFIPSAETNLTGTGGGAIPVGAGGDGQPAPAGGASQPATGAAGVIGTDPPGGGGAGPVGTAGTGLAPGGSGGRGGAQPGTGGVRASGGAPATGSGGIAGPGTGGVTGSGGSVPPGSGGISPGSGGIKGTGGMVKPGSGGAGGMAPGSGGMSMTGSGGMSGSGGTIVIPPPAGCPDAPAPGIATYYVCDCASGADADCVAGKDSNAGTSPDAPWQTFGKAQAQFASLKAGDRIEFCKGGVFNITAVSRWVNGNCKANNRCVVASYAAPWGSGNEGRPVINSPAGQHGIAFDDPANADHEEGYVFAGLELVGGGAAADDGFFVYNDIDDVLICDMFIHNFGIGVQLAGANTANAGADQHNERIVVRSSIITDCSGDGWLGADNGSVIQDSHFQNNGFGEATFNHNIYLSLSGADGVQVIGNDLYRSTFIGGQCQGVSLVAHGTATNLLIAGNNVHEDVGTVTQGCWGIAVDPGYSTAETFANVTLRGNTVTNLGNMSIGVAACHGCVIENNVVINRQSINATAILVPASGSDAGDWTCDQITVRNNSIDIDGGQGIAVVSEGSGHVIANNAIYDSGAGSGGVGCFRYDLPSSAYSAIDSNVCYTNGKGEWVVGKGQLSAWSASSGFDQNSKQVDPQFASVMSPYALSPASMSSPLVNAGDATHASATDITGKARDSQPDVGAYEF